ncbi:MAG: integration host factor subunit beta [Spirochaetales bacterium]|nr:integration host factor subunit beta [Spirochaetales bacterium]
MKSSERNKITKADLVESVYSKVDLNKKDIQSVIDLFIEELKSSITEDRVIEIRGLGTFEIKTRKGRKKARNPKTGEIVSVDTHGVASFRPGKDLKAKAWGLRSE